MKAYIIASLEQTQKTEREWLKINRATKIETRIWSTKHEERSVTSNLTEEADRFALDDVVDLLDVARAHISDQS